MLLLDQRDFQAFLALPEAKATQGHEEPKEATVGLQTGVSKGQEGGRFLWLPSRHPLFRLC